MIFTVTAGIHPAKAVDFDALMSLTAEFDENECRKQFTDTERVAIGEEIERRQGERRGRPWDEKRGGDGGENREGLIPANPPELKNDDSPHKGQESRDYAAKRAGFSSTDQYRSAKKVVHRGIPELQDAMDSGRVSIRAAATIAERGGISLKGGRTSIRLRSLSREQRSRRRRFHAILHRGDAVPTRGPAPTIDRLLDSFNARITWELPNVTGGNENDTK